MASAFDEMLGAGGEIRDAYVALKRWLDTVPPDHIALRRSQAELFFRRIGITFAVYGDAEATERLIPFDIIPRVLTKPEWTEAGGGPGAARQGAQRLPRRHLRRRANA